MSSKFEDWWNMHNCVKESLMREDAKYVYESRQDEIDELQKRIGMALEKCYTGIRKQGGDYYLQVVQDILKGEETK